MQNKDSKAARLAKERLSLALQQLINYEHEEEVQFACDNIRDVLDQLCSWCKEDIRLK